jgi:NADPH:quinone reductase-like Zn-dependent oxidoreductase
LISGTDGGEQERRWIPPIAVVCRYRGAIYLVIDGGSFLCHAAFDFTSSEVRKIEDVVVPDPGPKEVRLLIKAIGLNRSEILTRSGKAVTKPTLPTQLGLEAAGIIEALGSVGDKVAVIPGEAGRGYYGELALAPARTLVKNTSGP